MPITMKMDVDRHRIYTIRDRLLGMFPEVDRELLSLGEEVLAMLRATTPRSKKAGVHLADRWKMQVGYMEGRIKKISFPNTAKHAYVLKFLEKGTKPHMIYGNPVLAFEIDGKTIFSRYVHHPGTHALNIIANAGALIKKRFGEIKRSVTKIAQGRKV
jgi:hypothetical protein